MSLPPNVKGPVAFEPGVLLPEAPEWAVVTMFLAGRVLRPSAAATPGAGHLIRVEKGIVPPEETFGYFLGSAKANGAKLWFVLLVVPGEQDETPGLARFATGNGDSPPFVSDIAWPQWRLV